MTALNDDPELIRVAHHHKDLGNIKFREKDLKLAQGFYSTAFSSTENVKNMTPEVDKLRVDIL